MSLPKRIVYRDIPMAEGWPQKIEAAQLVPTHTLNKKVLSRIRYGNEQDDWGADKHAWNDCRVAKGELHVPGCDGEQCPACDCQILSCECPFDDFTDHF